MGAQNQSRHEAGLYGFWGVSANTNTGNQLPTGWAEARIGELVGPDGIFVDGDWVESKDQDPNGDVRLIQLADVGDGTYRDRSSRFLTRGKACELDCTFLRAGDVLIARMPDPLGRACIFPGDSKDSVTAVDICIVRTGALGANHRWLVWAVNSPQFRIEIAALQSGSTRKRISRGNLATLFMPIPPLAEQARIAQEIEKQITRLEAGVAALKRVQANLKRYRAAVLKAAVEGRLVPTEAELARREARSYEPASELLKRILAERKSVAQPLLAVPKKAQAGAPVPQDVAQPLLAVSQNAQAGVPVPRKPRYKEPAGPDTTNLPSLPEGWAWATVEQTSWQVQYGSSAKTREGSHGIPVLRMINLTTDGRLNLDDLKFLPVQHEEFPGLLLAPGDLLFNRTNSPELVGKSVAYRGIPSPCSFASYLIRVRTCEGCHAIYLAYCLNSAWGRTWIKSVVSQQVGQANVNGSKLRAFVFPLPPAAEQLRIVAEVDRRLSVIDELEMQVEANLKRAERLRQAVLKRAFEGKLVAQDPNDEPASVLLERIRSQRQAEVQQATNPSRRKGRGYPGR